MLLSRIVEDGVTFKIKVKPKSRQNGVLGVRAGILMLAVTAAPEKGKANKAVIELLAERLKIAKSAIEIISGETFAEKVVRVVGLSAQELDQKLSSQ